jgi:hypothetical protein
MPGKGEPEKDGQRRLRAKKRAARRRLGKSKQGGIKQSGQEPLDIQKTGMNLL